MKFSVQVDVWPLEQARAVPVRKAEFLVTDTESLGKFGGGK